MEDAAKAHCIKHTAQIVRKAAEIKVRGEAEKRRLAEKKKKKKMLEYF